MSYQIHAVPERRWFVYTVNENGERVSFWQYIFQLGMFPFASWSSLQPWNAKGREEKKKGP